MLVLEQFEINKHLKILPNDANRKQHIRGMFRGILYSPWLNEKYVAMQIVAKFDFDWLFRALAGIKIFSEEIPVCSFS